MQSALRLQTKAKVLERKGEILNFKGEERKKGDVNLFCFIPVADLMGGGNHIFAVVPKADVGNELGWRVPVFEAGRYLVAFDGAALLLLELRRRRQPG